MDPGDSGRKPPAPPPPTAVGASGASGDDPGRGRLSIARAATDVASHLLTIHESIERGRLHYPERATEYDELDAMCRALVERALSIADRASR